MNHSRKYEQIKSRYERDYVSDEQLRQYVVLGAITQEEYKEICGKDYE